MFKEIEGLLIEQNRRVQSGGKKITQARMQLIHRHMEEGMSTDRTSAR